MNFRTVFIVGIFSLFLMAPRHAIAQSSVKEADELDFAQGLLSRGMYDMAVEQYQKFITDYPNSSSLQEAYLSLGEGYFLSQEFDKAVAAFDQFKQLYPNSEQLPLSLLRLGQIDIEQKKFDDALKELTSIDAQKQLKGSMLQSFDFYIAQAYWGKADTASALDYFQKATQVDGASAYTADAYKEIGEVQEESGHYSDAMDAYAKAMTLAGDDPLKGELVYKAAEVQFLSGKYADAIKGFEQIIDQSPASGYTQSALANLLLAYFNLGQYDQLLAEYQKNANNIKDDDAYFTIHLAAVQAYIELKQYDKANSLLDRVLAFQGLRSQERARVFIKKADILIRQQKYKDALALLEAYSPENTDNADENFFLMAECYYGLNDYDHAFNSFENVYQNFPNSHFLKAALLGEAHTRKATGRYKESEVLFRKYYDSQDDPGLKSDALYDAMMMAVQAGDVNGGIAQAQEYVKAFPGTDHYGEVLLILADNYGKNNKFQDAVDLLKGYLAKPELAQKLNAANFLLGFYQQALGNNDQALAAYAQVDGQKEQGEFYPAALKNMAIIYLNEKKDDQARLCFDKLISQADQNDLQIKTYVWVCNEYLKEQKYDDVLRIATQAEKKFPPPDLLEIEYFKAEALRGENNCDEAMKSYALVTASTEKNAFTGGAHIGDALCLARANKLDQAKQEFQKALDENADDYTVTVHARFELAGIEESQGSLDDALKLYLLIATIYDDDHFCSEALLHAAKISEHLERKADAFKMYSEILDKYKNTPAAVYAKERVGLLK